MRMSLPRVAALTACCCASLSCFDEPDEVPLGTDASGDTAAPASSSGETTAAVDDTGSGTESGGASTGDRLIPDDAVVIYGSTPVPGNIEMAAMGMGVIPFVDGLCNGIQPGGLTVNCTQSRAVLAIGLGNPLATLDIPPGRPVHTADGTRVAMASGDLITGTLENTPAMGGVLTGPPEFWTGHEGMDCMAWVSPMAMGVVGRSDRDGAEFLNAGTANCSEMRPLLCVCWDDSP